MSMRRKWAILVVALSLGVGWAVRGHFGHEHGAAWAGAIGAMALVLVSGRPDWWQRLPVVAALGGIGWGVGGMMSYGIVVGYCRADDFANALYGFTMLSVIGGLYGFVGGGLLGLALESTTEKRPDWPKWIAQMVAFGMVAWGLLIYQLEWKMTPPRSELWAACLGAAVALCWSMVREGYSRSLRVAWYSAVGAGFGFAFGNFLQILGNLSGAHFNWWNVMEFTLGFCGGLGMALGVFTSRWPSSLPSSRTSSMWAVAFLAVAVPVTNLVQAFDVPELERLGELIGNVNPHRFALSYLGWVVLVAAVFAGATAFLLWRVRTGSSKNRVLAAYVAFSTFYIVLGHFKKGIFVLPIAQQPEQVLYWVFFGLALVLASTVARMGTDDFSDRPLEPRHWALGTGLLLLAAVVWAAIAVSLHTGLPGSHTRF